MNLWLYRHRPNRLIMAEVYTTIRGIGKKRQDFSKTFKYMSWRSATVFLGYYQHLLFSDVFSRHSLLEANSHSLSSLHDLVLLGGSQ